LAFLYRWIARAYLSRWCNPLLTPQKIKKIKIKTKKIKSKIQEDIMEESLEDCQVGGEGPKW